MNAKERLNHLIQNEYSYAIYREDDFIMSGTGRGIAPLYELYLRSENWQGCTLVDRAVGTGAANLCVLMDFSEVDALVISKGAHELLNAHKIKTFCEQQPDYILNRAKSGLCPLENKFVTDQLHTPPIELIESFLQEMAKNTAEKQK